MSLQTIVHKQQMSVSVQPANWEQPVSPALTCTTQTGLDGKNPRIPLLILLAPFPAEGWLRVCARADVDAERLRFVNGRLVQVQCER